jgi:hypothetical protein
MRKPYPSWVEERRSTVPLLLLAGIVFYVYFRIGAWWHHG